MIIERPNSKFGDNVSTKGICLKSQKIDCVSDIYQVNEHLVEIIMSLQIFYAKLTNYQN